MIDTPLTRTALRLAATAHAGQVDKAGAPYIDHPIHVAEQMTTEETTAAALLHDVVEDTDWTLEDLRREGIPEPVLAALDLLTHREGVPYLDYVRALAPNPIARAVKLEDLRHNCDLSRLPDVTSRDIQRLELYLKARTLLGEKR